ncbi:MAG: bifunctional (p)ppGpp synthetase/guanosine-3',5'-bis(diphosphate) 3'-pyrophosphohydrolase [Eubacterium sp.]|nr:bifunctional (p)ppGpp synthetase/guanosine-3',5'-bis(diphosphate) 3'-pyrophosphohydrolase [Eubacterium sp.]
MSKRLDDAIEFATKKHTEQTRKRENTPYILHPLEAAAVAAELTKDEDILIAAVLHDTVEDTDTSIDEVREKFGNRVAELVDSETENKREDLPPEETWEIRKKESLEHLKNSTDPAVKILWLADKVSNIRTLYRLYQKEGDDLWNHFNMKDIKKQAWYYRTVAELLSDLEDTLPYQEYKQIVDYIFRNVKENEDD